MYDSTGCEKTLESSVSTELFWIEMAGLNNSKRPIAMGNMKLHAFTRTLTFFEQL